MYSRGFHTPRRWRCGRKCLQCIALLTLLTACDAPLFDSRPNVLIITVDTLRADHVSCYGYERNTTPNIDAFAEGGVLFKTAYCPSPITAPSHATIMTGLYPRRHGVHRNGEKLDKSHPTLARILSAQGYATHAVVSSFILDSRFGLDQGFKTYNDRFPLYGASINVTNFFGNKVDRTSGFDQRARVTANKTIKMLRNSRRPFFLWAHFMDPHAPYEPPEPYRSRFPGSTDPLEEMISLYDGEIAYADAEIGRVLREVPGNTLVVIAADHGEGLMAHGVLGHEVDLYEEQVRVPLILKFDGVLSAGTRVNKPVELVDLLPTILDLLNLPADTPLDGCDLFDRSPDRPVYLHRRYCRGTPIDHYELDILKPYRTKRNYTPRGKRFGIRLGWEKYIRGGGGDPDELYDLQRDPHETINLASGGADVPEDLVTALDAWLQKTEPATKAPTEKLSDYDQRALEALGYSQ